MDATVLMNWVRAELSDRIKHSLNDLSCCWASEEHFERDFLSQIRFEQVTPDVDSESMAYAFKVMYGDHPLFTFRPAFYY